MKTFRFLSKTNTCLPFGSTRRPTFGGFEDRAPRFARNCPVRLVLPFKGPLSCHSSRPLQREKVHNARSFGYFRFEPHSPPQKNAVRLSCWWHNSSSPIAFSGVRSEIFSKSGLFKYLHSQNLFIFKISSNLLSQIVLLISCGSALSDASLQSSPVLNGCSTVRPLVGHLSRI